MINLVNENEDEMPTGYSASALDEGFAPEEPVERKPAMPPEPTVREPEPMVREPEPPAPETPAYPSYPTPPPSYERSGKEEIEALIESIIEEKWDDITGGLGDFNLWRERVKTEIISVKQEILRLEHRFETVQSSLIGKVGEYDKSIKGVGIEIKALEKVLQKIIQPLTINVKELQRLTQKLKK